MWFKYVFDNGLYARDTSKKIRAVFKAKGMSGKHLSAPIYGYTKSDTDKNLWVVDEEAANVVREIFKLCIDGYDPTQIARILTERGVPTPTAYARAKGKKDNQPKAHIHRWDQQSVKSILEKAEYARSYCQFQNAYEIVQAQKAYKQSAVRMGSI